MSSLVALDRRALNGDTVYVLDELRDRLQVAERNLRGPIWVRSADSGYREYERQKYYRQLFLSGHGNYAADQDTGQRGHMRGASIDIFREDKDARAAMRAAGFVPDPSEPWHWNLPGVTDYPIIRELPKFDRTIAAAPTLAPTTTSEEDELDESQNRKLNEVHAALKRRGREVSFYRITNPKGGMNGVSVLLRPDGFALFESDYWRDRMIARHNAELIDIDQDDFFDECNRLNVPFGKVSEYVWRRGQGQKDVPVSWSHAEEAARLAGTA